MPWEPVSSFGMVMFWGIALIAAYNISVTNALLKIATSKTTKKQLKTKTNRGEENRNGRTKKRK